MEVVEVRRLDFGTPGAMSLGMHGPTGGDTVFSVAESGAKPEATYQDVLDAPDNVVAELIGGRLYTQARPRVRHGAFASRLLGVLVSEVEDGLGVSGGWRIIGEPELRLGEDVLVPDLAAWTVDRFPADADDLVGIEVAPDWLCEVLSPSSARKDRMLKLPRYGEAGVRWAWLADPGERMVEVYRRDDDHWSLFTTVGEQGALRLPPFDDVDLPLAKLWSPGQTRS